MSGTKQKRRIVYQTIGFVALAALSGCASYPANPPEPEGSWHPVNPSHVNAASDEWSGEHAPAQTAPVFPLRDENDNTNYSTDSQGDK